MKNKFFLFAVLTMLSVNVMAAEEDGYFLVNNLNQNLSFEINKKCSKDFGVVQALYYKKMTQAELNKSCPDVGEVCRGNIYVSNDCTGKKIAYMSYRNNGWIQEFLLFDPTVSVKIETNGMLFNNA